ncbi:MAG: type II secretion system protein [Verrucomicrobiota bacterium]
MKIRKQTFAFTILEAVMAIGVMGIATSATIASLLKMNNNAALSRARTGASTVAQNQIDYLLSIQPYNPQRNQIPPELAVGTTSVGSAANPTIPIYIDPVSNLALVKGYMTTEITDMNQKVNNINTNLRRANVRVFFKFKGQDYITVMSTLRASDI